MKIFKSIAIAFILVVALLCVTACGKKTGGGMSRASAPNSSITVETTQSVVDYVEEV